MTKKIVVVCHAGLRRELLLICVPQYVHLLGLLTLDISPFDLRYKVHRCCGTYQSINVYLCAGFYNLKKS